MTVRAFEEFLFFEAKLLDERRFEEWRELFAIEGVYWIPARVGQMDPLEEVSIAYEDRQLLDVRVRRLQHENNYADQPETRTRRIIGNVVLVESVGENFVVNSNFTLVEFQDEEQRLFAGAYVHTLKKQNDSFKIIQKRVDLLNCDAPMGAIVIPL